MLAAAAALGAWLAPRAASAYDVLAAPCADEPLTCQIAPVSYEQTDALPIEWGFDTGWVPAGSPLQVHLLAAVYAHTTVGLSGALRTSWPEALVLEAPGDPQGGHLGFHYGVEVVAEGKVSISVAGQNFSWQGDLPYIPQIDFQVKADGAFDAWGWPPGATISSKTQPQKIASIGVGDIIGGSIPGIDGGFELDVAMELQATYTNERIVLRTPDGIEVEGGAITGPEIASQMGYAGGPGVEVDVHPEGVVDYDGVLHLIPAFYVELLGKQWAIPIADIPLAFPITETKWSFSPHRVRVPLPDMVVSRVEIDFGLVEVGQKKLMGLPIHNAGEALVHAALTSTDPELFPPYDSELDIEPGTTFDTAVRFVPKEAGEFKAMLIITSNDPDAPVQQVEMRGKAYGGPTIDYVVEEPEEETVDGQDAYDVAGCACRAAPSRAAGGGGALGLLALAGAAIAGRAWPRRRRP